MRFFKLLNHLEISKGFRKSFFNEAIHFPTTLQKIDFRFDKEVDPLPLVGDVQFEFVCELHVSNCRFSELISHFPKLEQFHVSRFEGDITQEEIDSIFDLCHLKIASIQTHDIYEHGPTNQFDKNSEHGNQQQH